MEEINLPSRRRKKVPLRKHIYTPPFLFPPQKIQSTLARYKEIHTSTKNPIQKVHTMYLRSPIIIKLHYTTKQVPISQYNGSKGERVLLDENPPPWTLYILTDPNPVVLLPLDLGYTLYFGNPLFPTKAEFLKTQESRPFFSLFLSCR